MMVGKMNSYQLSEEAASARPASGRTKRVGKRQYKVRHELKPQTEKKNSAEQEEKIE